MLIKLIWKEMLVEEAFVNVYQIEKNNLKVGSELTN
jgi:hypothetical protein